VVHEIKNVVVNTISYLGHSALRPSVYLVLNSCRTLIFQLRFNSFNVGRINRGEVWASFLVEVNQHIPGLVINRLFLTHLGTLQVRNLNPLPSNEHRYVYSFIYASNITRESDNYKQGYSRFSDFVRSLTPRRSAA